MAQQITIDIVAETKKLTEGVNNVSNELGKIDGKLKGVAGAAGAAASAFLLKEGVTFLKQGIDEARDAQIAMNNAESAFGKGSDALKKISDDAEKFGKALAIDNDDIIKLATSLGSRLPDDAKALSAELVNVAFDIEAYTAGALTADAVTGKLAKAFADGEISAKELRKIVPDLSDEIYNQAEAASKAGDNQKALDIIIEAAQKKYGDAAEKNVTSTQKFDKAMADLKEQIGTQLLPFVDKLVGGLSTLLGWFDKQPDSVKKIEIGLGLLLVVGALTLSFLASMKTAMVTLGIVNGTTAGSISLVTVATNLLKVAMAGLGIGLLIALIVLLVQNWDTVTEVVGKVWNAIKNFGVNAWNTLKDFGSKVAGFVKDLIDKFLEIPKEMVEIGVNIAKGLWNGISNMAIWLKDKIFSFFGNLIPDWAKKPLGIKSPSRVFMDIGKNIVLGLSDGMFDNADIVKNATAGLATATTTGFVPSIQTRKTGGAGSIINLTINAGLGTDPVSLGREVSSALRKYGNVSRATA